MKITRLFPLSVAVSIALSGVPTPALALAVRAAAPRVAVVPSAAAPLSFGPALELTPAAALSGQTPLAPSALIELPGGAGAGLAEEAAAYAKDAAPTAPAKTVSAPAVRGKSLVGRLADVALRRAPLASLFDAAADAGREAPIVGRRGLRPQKPLSLPNRRRPDAPPTVPAPDREQTVILQTYALPGARDVGGAAGERQVLPADPANVAAVVDALKALVDAAPARYGVPSSGLRLVGARRFEGRGEQADAVFVVFRQIKDNLEIHPSRLSFTIMTINGRPTVVAQTGQLFPQVDVNTGSRMNDDEIMGRIAKRVGIPTQEAARAFQFFEEKIIYSRGEWRHVKLYVADGLPVMVAVDLSSGLVFAWDNRTGLKKETTKRAVAAGTVSGRTVDHGPILPNAPIVDIPLAYLSLRIGGKTYVTDKDGKFATDPGLAVGPEGLTLEATLAGPYVTIQDQQGKTLTINVTLKPGDGAVKAVFNPDATLNDENALAQVSAFQKVNLAYSFLRARGLTTERMDKEALVVKTNVDDECNAYYTSGRPNLILFRSSVNCVNTAYDTVADHEYGHYWDDMTGGILNGGLSEGWGDTVSMYLLNNPIIGEHFLKKPRGLIEALRRPWSFVKSMISPDGGVDYIRTGENLYQYNPYDEVHDQGQAWGGFTWKLRKALRRELGEAEGDAMAEALVLPTMFAKAATIPDAMAQVLVNALKKDGTIQFEQIIRDTAKIHGITLPSTKGPG